MQINEEARIHISQTHPSLNVLLSEHSWCLNCQKVHETSTWQEAHWQCPACGGSALDLWRWEHVAKIQPSYPPVPEEGRFYAVRSPRVALAMSNR